MVTNYTPLPIKLLLNAESFGFGPTAAIADFFPHLRKIFSYIGYVGSGHSLDLQRSFAYDEIIDLSGREPSAFDAVIGEYDLFFTALNFEKAERAADKGVPAIIYDPLTWFWPEVPALVARKGVLYIAQSFHGVKERLENEKDYFNQCVIVSPLVSRSFRQNRPNVLLLNMGGLVNPFWLPEVYCNYAYAMIKAIKSAADPSLDLQILCSSQVAKFLPNENICTLSREEVYALLPQVKIAIQTPGLSNIYDAAAYGFPSLFLPPANDSQGQQLDLLRDHDQVDAFVDWEQLPSGKKIHYKGEQTEVLKQISGQIGNLTDKAAIHSLSVLFREGIERISEAASLRLPTLLDQFGCDGAQQVAECVKEKAQTLTQRTPIHV